MFKVQSFRPHRLLQDFVLTYLILESDFQEEGCRKMTILPHLIQSIVFNIGPPDKVYDVTNKEYVASDSITGPNDIACERCIYAGMKSLVVNLKPGAWFKLFHIPATNFTNKSIDLSVAGSQIHELGELLRECNNGQEQVAMLEAFLLRQLLSEKKYSRSLNEAIQLIYAADGNITIRQLELGTYFTKRTLERNFLEQTGLRLKTFCRIVRFRRTIEYIEKERKTQWCLLASRFGYSDQTHFIKEFRHFAGCLPHEYPGFRSSLEQALGI
ncbi:Helix-turn-helix domain-containing protein [Chitinophaga ginsengisegetis]|uniref:Helix-turn-helix domain-containing protein n=1 Tax=Chitinophaga ginsengisegetis TaxID=393003 RepID=A0A1T5P785_9BACT|nr:helix-turn-helix domain-containing protein [Chitinophaga ginsengisegetis]SKD08248.1 Helix-turn-helix domain-containing protein [Chitinophaga ginsengisegetis]